MIFHLDSNKQHFFSTLAVVRELSWGILGRGEGGLKGIGVSGSRYNEVLTWRMLNVVDYIEWG